MACQLSDQGHAFDKADSDHEYGQQAVSSRQQKREFGGAEDGARRAAKNELADLGPAVGDLSRYDWEADRPLRHPIANTVIYELHVRGFTMHPSSCVSRAIAGTYAGLIEKIPYLQDLGVTAVELLPVLQFDAQDAPSGLVNYWGYSPVSFFAPHRGYSSRRDHLGVLDEFRDMVKTLHRAGIEVILDVVFNHTAEGDHLGPTFCFRGLDNSTYYLLQVDRRLYANFTGAGNTLNGNHAVVRRLIQDSLRHWVAEMHIDGFRFDLASILSRDESGHPLPNPPVLWDIESDPVLAGTKLIAEAWDAAGLYQVGSFIGDSWREWNGRFRDDVRRFLRGDEGCVRNLSARLMGSPDIYGHEEREPEQSINFITCHDGFTLNDLASYDRKHNEVNGENNRDGTDANWSWNCGVEGPTDDSSIEALRQRQIRNFFTVLLMSLGAPMLLMGDEVRRTQCGNNNAYCQDNPLSWFDWTLLEKHSALHRFVKLLLEFRRRGAGIIRQEQLSLNQLLHRANIEWSGVGLYRPDWSHYSHSLACTLSSRQHRFRLHAMLNAYCKPLAFELPHPRKQRGESWRLMIDTSLAAPHDICFFDDAPTINGAAYTVQPRSMALVGSAFNPPTQSQHP